ncbi:MAG: hypothetical protein ACW990_16390 [Promethearchaeota archaeon]
MARQSRNMIKYIIKRILLMFPILLAVLIFTWVVSHMMAVNPFLNQISGNVIDRAAYERELRRSGFYDPWYVQLGIYLQRFFTGDWGTSFLINEGKPVITFIAEIFPKTIELMIFSILIVPIIAIKLGVTSAKHKDKPRDTAIRGMAIFGAGFPVFYIAVIGRCWYRI